MSQSFLPQSSYSRLLRGISKPARYAGSEWGSVRKQWDEVSIRVCLAFPDTYENGVLRASVNSAYSILNATPDILAERVFAPWPDYVAALRSGGGLLASLESQRPLAQFDIVAICYPDELAGTTVLEMLDLGGIPVDTVDRNASHPLIVGWEEEPKNPEPLAQFLDAYLVGDFEAAIPAVLRVLREAGSGAGRPLDRRELLSALAPNPGVYVPSVYESHRSAPVRTPHGQTTDTVDPSTGTGAPEVVRRVVWKDLAPSPTSYVVPHLQATQDRPTIEVSRGCPMGCQAEELGLHSGPLRTRELDAILESLRETLRTTGFEDVALAGACLHERQDSVVLLSASRDESDRARARLRLPPLAPVSGSAEIIRQLSNGKHNVMIGPIVADVAAGPTSGGAGNWMETIGAAIADGSARGSVGNIRLMVALGHPMGHATTSSSENGNGLSQWIRSLPTARGQVRVDASFVVPRPFSTIERAELTTMDRFTDEASTLEGNLGRKAAFSITREIDMVRVEAAISRGGREIGRAIKHAWELGCYLDLSPDSDSANLWSAAFTQAGLDIEAASARRFNDDEVLPWSHLAGWREPSLIDEIDLKD
jgi:hypothetical protein